LIMIISDYLRFERDRTWDVAAACGVKYATVRCPENGFDYAGRSAWDSFCNKYRSAGFSPLVLEPMPNELHESIKTGDAKRDWAIEQVIKMLPHLKANGIELICFNFMAHYGWTRTSHSLSERANARVTGFKLNDFVDDGTVISEAAMWKNYEYFVRAVVPYAEKSGVKLALHPDDPPLDRLGNVARIFTSLENIKKGISLADSACLGVTFCQASYYTMGEDIKKAATELRDKIFFIHFRNVIGNKYDFRETYHDNGAIDMADIMKHYRKLNLNVPIRADHVPTMEWESTENAGYDALGRLFAIGYMRGLIEATE